jgi:hypothetical protein
MAKANLPAVEEIRKLLRYDPETGILTWLPRSKPAHFNTSFSGKPALCYLHKEGYLIGTLMNVRVKAHRVAWALHYGEWPTNCIDHINGNAADNRIDNLRDVTPLENQRNSKRRKDNTTGQTGVVRNRTGTGWIAQIKLAAKVKRLGTYATFEEAVEVRKAAELKYGFHQNHGRASHSNAH